MDHDFTEYVDEHPRSLRPTESSWFSFESASGKRTKPHMLAKWDDLETMVFACGIRTVARDRSCPPLLLGIPEFGLDPVGPMLPSVKPEPCNVGTLTPNGACGGCAHVAAKIVEEWYRQQATTKWGLSFIRTNPNVQLAAYARLLE